MSGGYKQPEQSPIEKKFWENAKPVIPELQNEVWVSNYRVDFLIPSKKIIIELYGYTYHNTKHKITKDAERERNLQKMGYQVIRFTGSEIFKDVKKCIKEVLELAKIEKNELIEKWEREPEIISIEKKKEEIQEEREEPIIKVATPKIRKNKSVANRQSAILITLSIITFCCVSFSGIMIINIISN